MSRTPLRALGAGLAAAAVAATLAAAPAVARGDDRPRHHPRPTTVQLLSFNDFHGHLEATDGPLSTAQDPTQTPVGGSEYLASTLERLRDKVGDRNSLTVAAGDLIGGSTFLSGMFHDEPSVESLNALGLDVSSVGNHEFDEGTTELLRMQRGGCHPEDGCYFERRPYRGADFQWLAANVVRKDNGRTLLPGTSVRRVGGVKVGFIGMTLEATPTLVSPAGVASVDFRDEVETANEQARRLKRYGVEAIVVLLHEGGYQSGTINGCTGISAPIAQIAAQMTPEVDQIVSGHTHQGYICSLPDPDGNPRLVTSAADYGRAVTETSLVVDRRTGEVDRARTTAVNHLVTREARDAKQTEIIAKWNTLAGPLKATVVGTHTEDILGDSSGNRGIETPMADLVADAILWGTSGDKGGAQIAFMNVGGVREDLPMAPKYAEAPGQVTFAEAFDIAPFGNLLNSLDLTGAQIEEVLEQQYQPIPARGSRPMLALGVSEGFTYEWDATQPQGSRVVPGSMALNGQPIDPAATYRVGTLSFLAQGGDSFTAFTQGANLLGGPEDLANLVDYLKATPGLTAPESRIGGL
jgi:5'-nucleotidase